MREVERFDCFPEIVLFDITAKNTILLPEWEAAIYSHVKDQGKIDFDSLVSFFKIEENELALFEQHIETLKQLKLIELCE